MYLMDYTIRGEMKYTYIMKKISVLVVSAVLASALAGCGSDDETQEQKAAGSAQSETSAVESNFKAKILEAEIVDETGTGASNKKVVIKLEVKNISDTALHPLILVGADQKGATLETATIGDLDAQMEQMNKITNMDELIEPGKTMELSFAYALRAEHDITFVAYDGLYGAADVSGLEEIKADNINEGNPFHGIEILNEDIPFDKK